jgi:hypothetical protein
MDARFDLSAVTCPIEECKGMHIVLRDDEARRRVNGRIVAGLEIARVTTLLDAKQDPLEEDPKS